MSELKDKLVNIINPETNKTLAEESRITKVEFKGENLMVTIQRDEIGRAHV